MDTPANPQKRATEHFRAFPTLVNPQINYGSVLKHLGREWQSKGTCSIADLMTTLGDDLQKQGSCPESAFRLAMAYLFKLIVKELDMDLTQIVPFSHVSDLIGELAIGKKGEPVEKLVLNFLDAVAEKIAN